MPDGPWSEFQQSTPQAPPPDASGPWSQYAAQQGTTDTETHRIRDFFGNLGKSLNPMPALNAAEDRQNQETAQFHQQLNDKQYTEALKTFVRSVPGADTIRAEGQNTIDSLKKAYQDYTRDQQSGGQTGAAFKDAVSAIPFIGRPTVAAGEQWDRGDKAGALGSATPIVAPSLLGAASVGIPKVAPLLGDAADAVQAKAATIKPALAQTITDHPQLTRAATAAGSGLATGLAAHAIPGGAPIGGAYGTYLGGRYLGNIAINWAQKVKLAELGETLKDVPDDVLIAAQKKPPIQLQQQVKGVVGETGVETATKDLIRTELARRQKASGVPIFGSTQPPVPMASNPQITLGQDLTTSGLPNAYPVPGKRSAGVEPAPPTAPSAPYPVVGRSASVKSASGSPYGDITGTLGTPVPPTTEATSYPVVGRSASIKSAAGTPYAGTNGTTGTPTTPATPSATPSPIPTAGRSASQTGLGIPIGDPYSGTTGTVNPITALRQDVGVPANPVGPSPQLLDAIKKAVGPKGNIQAVVDDMISRGEKDPYTGAPLGVAPQPVSAPTAPTPVPVANPIAALKTPEPAQAPTQSPLAGTPFNGTVVNHTYRTGTTDFPVQLVSDQSIAQHAADNGVPYGVAAEDAANRGLKVVDDKDILKNIWSNAADQKIPKEEIYHLSEQYGGSPNIANASGETLMKIYQDLLNRAHVRSRQFTNHIDTKYHPEAVVQEAPSAQTLNLPPKAFSALPQVPGTNGQSLEDLLRQSLPPQP